MAAPLRLHFVEVGEPLHRGELALRYEILRKPLGRPRGSEVFEAEADCYHLVAVDPAAPDTVVGCVVFHPAAATRGRLLQMAVADSLQGQGVGRALVRGLEARLVADGFQEIILHARDHAIGFYEKLGYAVCSEGYEEVGIPHHDMSRVIGRGL